MGKFVPAAGLEFKSATLGERPATALRQHSEPATDTVHRRNPGVLILGGAHGSLAVARSLGRCGVDVWFATHDHPIAKFSRYTKRRLTWPGPNHPAAAQWLLDLAARWQLSGWVLIPGADAELRLLSQNHNALSQVFRLAAPT